MVKGEQISIAHEKTMRKEIYGSPGKNLLPDSSFMRMFVPPGGGMPKRVKGEQISIAHEKTMRKEIYGSPGKNLLADSSFMRMFVPPGGGMPKSVKRK